MTGTITEHGTLAGYNQGCRCSEAREANRVRTAQYRAYVRRLRPPRRVLIDGTGTRRRLRALAANGWPLSQLATITGLHPRALQKLAQDEHRLVTRDTARSVRAVYNMLGDGLAVEATSRRVRSMASRQGWIPSIYWDEDELDGGPEMDAIARERVR